MIILQYRVTILAIAHPDDKFADESEVGRKKYDRNVKQDRQVCSVEMPLSVFGNANKVGPFSQADHVAFVRKSLPQFYELKRNSNVAI